MPSDYIVKLRAQLKSDFTTLKVNFEKSLESLISVGVRVDELFPEG